MKQGLTIKGLIRQSLKSTCTFLACLVLSACSVTSLKSLDTSSLTATTEIPVFLETNCNKAAYGDHKLEKAQTEIEQAVSDYGFAIVEKDQADFILNFVCRQESDLNLAIVPNEISGMLMVASITLIPTYWPKELWVDMEVYDLRAFDTEKLETFESQFVSQEGVVWAPFILFKLAYDFGLPKYNVDKFYSGLRFSTFNLLSQAESVEIFE